MNNGTDELFAGVADDLGILDPLSTHTPQMYYYQGSVLPVEWTMREGCGTRLNGDVIIQYACEDTLADDCGRPGSGLTCSLEMGPL